MEKPASIDVAALGQFKTLSGLSGAQLEKLAAGMSVEMFDRGERIFGQDEEASTVYFLVSGIVRLSLANQMEKSVLLSFLPPGMFFGIGSLFPQKRHPFSAEAFGECTVGLIEPDRLTDALLELPLEKYLLSADILMGRIWNMFLHCIRGIGLNLRQRLALELLEMAASWGVADARGTVLSVQPRHEDLANAIGASRQKVTECLAEFDPRRIIRREGRRLIISPRRLRQIVEKG